MKNQRLTGNCGRRGAAGMLCHHPGRFCNPSQLFRHSERDQGICGNGRNILAAVFTKIGHRIRVDLPINFCDPQLLPGLDIEVAEMSEQTG